MLFKRAPYTGPKPAPLTSPELARLKAWERWMVRFYTAAGLAMCLAVVAVYLSGNDPLYRRGMLLLVIALVLGATWVQFREVCPRCRSIIGRQSRLLLPPKCRHCGVKFEA